MRGKCFRKRDFDVVVYQEEQTWAKAADSIEALVKGRPTLARIEANTKISRKTRKRDDDDDIDE